MISPQIDCEQQNDFNLALWQARWNAPDEQSPSEVTRKETLRNWREHKNGGLYNTLGRLDPVAKAHKHIDPLRADEQLGHLFRSSEPLYKPTDECVLRSASAIELAIRREEVRKLGRRSGLSKRQHGRVA
jgi:hypothetical protein